MSYAGSYAVCIVQCCPPDHFNTNDNTRFRRFPSFFFFFFICTPPLFLPLPRSRPSRIRPPIRSPISISFILIGVQRRRLWVIQDRIVSWHRLNNSFFFFYLFFFFFLFAGNKEERVEYHSYIPVDRVLHQSSNQILMVISKLSLSSW